jgi:hypothetical protein
LDGNTPVDSIKNISKFGGSTGNNGNLRLVDVEINDLHSTLEKEIKMGKGMSSLALRRVLDTIAPAVEFSDLTQDEKRILYGKIDEKLVANGLEGMATQLTKYELKKGSLSRDMLQTITGIQSDLHFNHDGSVSKKSFLVTSGDVILKENGEIDHKSPAVLSGKVKFTKDGSVDKGCSATQISFKDKILVEGYHKQDGTYVSPYYRHAPKEEKSQVTCTTPSKGTETKIEVPTKKDGTPDMRYSVSKTPSPIQPVLTTPTKKDGTPDMRYTVNQNPPTPTIQSDCFLHPQRRTVHQI